MPPMNQLRAPDMNEWQPVQPPQPSGEKAPDPALTNTPIRSAFMHASMPAAASTADAFQRQFYGGANVPLYRILPAKNGAQL